MARKQKRARLVWDKVSNEWTLEYLSPSNPSHTKTSARLEVTPLRTADTVTAQRLKNQMNKALTDPRLFDKTARARASQEYDSRILTALFGPSATTLYVSHSTQTPRQIRDAAIPLPWTDEGYTRTLLVGTTGAGKTTLLRQLIGTHPTNEHFPSTSTAKTTTSDFEVIFTDTGRYGAVVTFMPREAVKTDVEICVLQALHAYFDDKPTSYIATELLEHREQRFRLFYILGRWQEPSPERSPLGAVEHLTRDERTQPANLDEFRHARSIQTYLSRIERLCANTIDRMEAKRKAGNIPQRLSVTEEEELLEQLAREDPDFENLVEKIMAAITMRFTWINTGSIHFGADNWPTHWTYRTTNRRTFLDALRWFSSNNPAHYGRLVTPIVNGVRVSGPFSPRVEWWDQRSSLKLVLIDGEGLGHRGSSLDLSLPSSIHDNFGEVDTILVVDNAQQPLLSHPSKVVEQALHSGFQEKLAIVFTHLDQVKGVNLTSTSERRQYVERSVVSAIDTITADHDREQRRVLKKALEKRVFYCGNLHKPLSDAQQFTRGELNRLLRLLSLRSETPRPRGFKIRRQQNTRQEIAQTEDSSHVSPHARVTYVSQELDIAVANALTEFTAIWDAALGFGTHHKVSGKQHWTRIKALTRHIGHLGYEGYDTLKPADVLYEQLQRHLAHFLSVRAQFGNPPMPPEERQALIDQLRQGIGYRIRRASKEWLIVEPRQAWKDAFLHHNGIGSTTRRAEAIQKLFATALPRTTRGSGINRQAEQALNRIVMETIRAHGGEVITSPTRREKPARLRSVS